MRSIVIAGATCSGKSLLAERICDEVDGLIVNADSMQVYEEFPLLTAQPEVVQDRHFLYSCVSSNDLFNVGLWLEKVKKLQEQWTEKTLVFVGGSGMYINALLYGIADIPEVPIEIFEESKRLADEKGIEFLLSEMQQSVDVPSFIKPQDTQRILRAWCVWKTTGRSIWSFHKEEESKQDDFTVLLCEKDREQLYKDINARCVDMWSSGIISEVESSLKKEINAQKVIGFNEVSAFLKGADQKSQINLMQTRTRQYAKRQLTWFRNQLKTGIVLHPESKIEGILNKGSKSVW